MTWNLEANVGHQTSLSRLFVALILSVALTGCSTWDKFTAAIDDMFTAKAVKAASADEETVMAVPVDPVTAVPLDEPVAAFEEDAADRPDPAYAEAKKHLNAGRLGLALTSFRSALRTYPESIKTLNGLAATYDRLGRYDLAQRYYARALKMAPESSVTLNNLGYSFILRAEKYGDQRYYAAARAYLERAKVLGNAHPAVTANLEAIEEATAVTKVVMSTPKPADAKVSLAPADPYRAWIERRTERVSYLVTRPSPAAAEEVKRLRLMPAVAAYSGKPARQGR